MSTVSPAAARESARRPDGKFGEQVRAEDDAVDLCGAPQVTRGVTSDGFAFRDSPIGGDKRVREIYPHGRTPAPGDQSACGLTYTVYDDDTDGWAAYENTIDVEYMITDEAYRGRGMAAAALRSLTDEHPGKSFVTERFDCPTARRIWEKALGDANAMVGDGEFGCRMCCAGLADDDDADDDDGEGADPSLCGRCQGAHEAHEAGEHREDPVAECWDCDTERHAWTESYPKGTAAAGVAAFRGQPVAVWFRDHPQSRAASLIRPDGSYAVISPDDEPTGHWFVDGEFADRTVFDGGCLDSPEVAKRAAEQVLGAGRDAYLAEQESWR